MWRRKALWALLIGWTGAILLTPEHPPDPKTFRPYRRKPGDPKRPSNPIILIPGDGGSQLQANLTGKPSTVHYLCDSKTADFFDLWLDIESFVPVKIDCWADNMKLLFNESTGQSENSPGVDVKVPGFGGIDTVEWLDPRKYSPGRYFQPIVDALVAWGYTRAKNIIGAPFDWRRSPPELTNYFVSLKTLIETVYLYNDHQPVIILAHSMGNPMMNYFYHNFVDQMWKDKYIHSHVSLAGAWGGSMQIVKLYASGYNMDYYRILLPPSELRAMQRSFTSSGLLFPAKQLWPDYVFAQTDAKNYSNRNLKEFFADIKYELGLKQYELANPALLLDPPGVPVHCIYGHAVQTPEFFQWAKGYFPDYQPVITYGDGDGTVNRVSLEICKGWKGNNQGRDVTVHEIENADHMAILADLRTIQLIKDLLYDR
ncbi:unnamed protein product [Bursaphelenchus xylophilus]|uniref:(pine wood nematode) hypothetical protein n=1 Tax=Bursaphelenchus xylophilus TaxID=6326 RepID=A0A1I7S225_BURXY|nr:unnamed protein product [Bursaphelenchus xylophilus]CAG9090342.1 unnamed protein product [Bursaphelenchus xylophilus]